MPQECVNVPIVAHSLMDRRVSVSECGESLQTKAKTIRCRRCGGRASSELVICPHCGRELWPAPPRVLTWGAPALLVVLFAVVIGGRWAAGTPFSWVQVKLSEGLAMSGQLGKDIEPEVAIVMTPIPGSGSVSVPAEAGMDAMVTPGMGSDTGLATDTQTGQSAVVSNTGSASNVAAVNDAAAGTASGMLDTVDVPSASVTGTVSSTLPSSVLAVIGKQGNASAATPVADTVTSGVSSSLVVTGAKSGVIAKAATVSMPLPTPTPVAPTATDTPLPTETPSSTLEPTPTSVIYVIRNGDTLVGIASRYGVDVNDLRQANDISPDGVFTIQPGQKLVIPPKVSGQKATPTATSVTTPKSIPTSTRAPTPTAQPTSTPTGVAFRLDAPVLRSPENGTPFSCSAHDSLNWSPVAYIRPDDKYVMHLGFVSGRTADNQEIIRWILIQPRPSTITSWELDGNLCGLAPQAFGRQWRWWVEVAQESDGNLIPVSPPSVTWGFSWN